MILQALNDNSLAVVRAMRRFRSETEQEKVERCSLCEPPRARARERLIIVEFRGFRRARSPQEMFRECSDSAHRLHSKKPLPWRVTGASVARHVERPWVRSKNVYIAEPAPELQPMCCEIGAPRREIGVELDVYPREVVRPPAEPAPLHSKRAVDRLRSPRGGSRISPGFIFKRLRL